MELLLINLSPVLRICIGTPRFMSFNSLLSRSLRQVLNSWDILAFSFIKMSLKIMSNTLLTKDPPVMWLRRVLTPWLSSSLFILDTCRWPRTSLRRARRRICKEVVFLVYALVEDGISTMAAPKKLESKTQTCKLLKLRFLNIFSNKFKIYTYKKKILIIGSSSFKKLLEDANTM